MNIAAVIPACNLSDLTVQCIQHLAAGSLVPRIIYVDNGSLSHELGNVLYTLRLGNAEWNAHYFANNEGYTLAVNQGLAMLRPDEHPLIMNNDCFVTKHCVERLAAAIERDATIGAVGPMTLGRSRHSLLTGSRSKRFAAVIEDCTLGIWDTASDLLTYIAPNEFSPPQTISYFCTLIRREALDQVGHLNPRLADGLGADDEHCHRLQKAGWKTGLAVDALANHLERQTFTRLGLPRDVGRAKQVMREIENA